VAHVQLSEFSSRLDSATLLAPTKALHAFGRKGAALLLACGGLLIFEAILSHVRHVAWGGDYGWQRVTAIAVGAGALLLGCLRTWQERGDWLSQQELMWMARRLTPFLIAAAVYFGAFVIMSPVPEGDQPHYELESVGLAYEQTRDMTMNYRTPDRFRLMFPLGLGDLHALRYKPGGELVQVHNVGLPLLLAPAVPLVREAAVLSPKTQLWPWNVEMILIAAVAAQILYRILRRLRPHEPFLVRGVWASVVFSAPLVVFASQIYPEMPAVLLALVVADALLKPPSRSTIAAGATAAALMPWLHVRFLPTAALLVLGLAGRALGRLPGPQRRGIVAARTVAWAIIPLLVSVVLMGFAFEHWYGSFSPGAPYAPAQTSQPQTLSASWATLTGAFWSSGRGWLPYAPIGILALASIGYAIRRYGAWGFFALAVAVVYLLTITVEGSEPGFAFAGRYEVILMPFAAVPLLIAAVDLRGVRWLLWPLAALTLYLTLAVIFEPPSTVAGVPGVTGPGYPQLLWPWFMKIWPNIVPSPAHFYPDASAVLAWSLPLLAISVAGYLLAARRSPSSGIRAARGAALDT
jgi:hypothetical protein